MTKFAKCFTSRCRVGSFVMMSSVGGACGSLDLNGNGVSDLWELEMGDSISSSGDSDHDGFTDLEEGIAGTDPFNRESRLTFLEFILGEGEVTLKWLGVAGKCYRVERLEAGQWKEVSLNLPSAADSPREVTVSGGDQEIFRLIACEYDGDRDGLSAWEELRLGWSDLDAASSGGSGRLDYVEALRRLESPEGVELTGGTTLAQRLPDRNEAARFLIQTSFGPTEELITEVTQKGLTGWFDEQMGLGVTTTTVEMSRNGLSFTSDLFRQGWWRVANRVPDQLRHRMAYALSQILVVDYKGSSIVNNWPRNQSRYYDLFVNGAFEDYRNVLEDVTYSMVMGNYLSHLNNRKSDPSISRFPDENFAREIMQLFTIGLWELNPDGSRKVDDDGELIPTYDNDTIVEMAKVFTGLSNSTYDFGQPTTSFFQNARGPDYERPMKMFEEEHEPGVKNIINGVTLDGTGTGEEEVQATLDALMSHSNMAPFISRLLIQRFTSSNPSPDYMARVSAIWNNPEDSANLGAVLEAIIFDPEVRNEDPFDEFRGKVREPILRYTHLFRALRFGDPSGKYRTDSSVLLDTLGQYPMMAPSVFNFYLPDFSPNGELRLEGLVAPELQISTTSQMVLSDNRFRVAIERGATFMVPDYTVEEALAADPVALVDHLDTLMTGGRLQDSTKSTVVGLLNQINGNLNRVQIAVHLISQSMEFITIE